MAEEVKHTPGPWQIEDHGSLYVSTMHPMPVFELVPLVGKPDKHRANARLIAAAPDLYEALSALQLQALQSSVNHAGNEWGLEALAMARSALAKAEGRS